MSNQYDFQKLTAEEIRSLKQIAFWLIIFVVCMVVFALSSCAEKEAPPTLEERLQGAWIRTWQPYWSTNTYSFNGGLCAEHSILPAQPIQAYFWQYYCNRDTLTLVNLASADPFSDIRRAAVSFPTDSTCILGWFPNGLDYVLIRFK